MRTTITLEELKKAEKKLTEDYVYYVKKGQKCMQEGCLLRVEAVRYTIDRFCEKDSVTLEDLKAEEAALIERYESYGRGDMRNTLQVICLKHLEDVRKAISEIFV